MSLPLNCHRVCLWLSRGESDDAAWLPALLARLHLALCPHCRRYRRQMELIGEAARKHPEPSAPESWLLACERRILRGLLSKGGPKG